MKIGNAAGGSISSFHLGCSLLPPFSSSEQAQGRGPVLCYYLETQMEVESLLIHVNSIFLFFFFSLCMFHPCARHLGLIRTCKSLIFYDVNGV